MDFSLATVSNDILDKFSNSILLETKFFNEKRNLRLIFPYVGSLTRKEL